MENLLEVRELTKYFPFKRGFFIGKTFSYVKAVDGVTFAINAGETFSLVGESGCGKTTVANLILLLETPTSGEILFRNGSLRISADASLSGTERKEYRGAIQAVFQDPYGALDPRMRAAHIIGEPMEAQGYGPRERRKRGREMMEAVGLPLDSENKFPHEFSGGQRQRIAVARALTLQPELIVLDEPVSNLDVSIRSQILNLLKDIQSDMRISYLLISHDMASVEYMSHHIGVMYLGKLVEVGKAEEVCGNPLHPYTAALVAAATPPGRIPPWQIPIIGEVPSPLDTPGGCAYHPRCSYSMPVCSEVTPALAEAQPQRRVACHLYPDKIHTVVKVFSTSPSAGS